MAFIIGRAGGWNNLLKLIAELPEARITKAHLTFDLYHDGYEWNIEKFVEMWRKNMFATIQTSPHLKANIHFAGTWEPGHNTKGKTIYIGSRDSNRFIRIYEKDKQIMRKSDGNLLSKCLRLEVELKAFELGISPHDLFERTEDIFFLMYPAFINLCEEYSPEKVFYKSAKKAEYGIEKALEHAQKSSGRIIKLLHEFCGYSAIDIINMLKKDGAMKRLNLSFDNLALLQEEIIEGVERFRKRKKDIGYIQERWK